MCAGLLCSNPLVQYEEVWCVGVFPISVPFYDQEFHFIIRSAMISVEICVIG